MLGGASVTWCTEVVGHAPILAVHAHLGHVEMVALLLEMGAPVEGTTDSGMTPLCLAAAAGHTDMVTLFCKKGAKVSVISMQRGTQTNLELWWGRDKFNHPGQIRFWSVIGRSVSEYLYANHILSSRFF